MSKFTTSSSDKMNCIGTAGLLVAIVHLHFVATEVVPETERIDIESERVVGGREAKEGQFPWMAALYKNNQFICSGSLVSQNTFMTAAHCVVSGGRTENFSLFHAIANVNRNSPNYRMNFTRLTVHPEYRDNNLDNDVAIFRISEPIPFSDTIDSVCIADPNTMMDQYKNATAMGWGNASPISVIPLYFARLQYAEQKIVRNSLCRWSNAGVDDNKICAQGRLNGICNGDSGGPLVHLSANNPPVQIGIASYGNALTGCLTVTPAVFVRVSSYHKFIMEASEDDMIRTCLGV